MFGIGDRALTGWLDRESLWSSFDDETPPSMGARKVGGQSGGIGVMGTRRGLAAILLLVAGCGSDSQSGRMTPGMLATAHGADDKPVPAFFSSKTELLPVGTVVKVISDGEGNPSEPRRKVVVGIEGGPSRGLAAQMYRSDLRPKE
jgi:hypothetical protein